MKWSTKRLASSIATTGGVIALTALAARTEFPDFELSTATHETRAESQDAFQFSNAGETASESEAVSAMPATRTTVAANWNAISGAKGYLLDVSTDDSFSDYVDGYHDLDVGDAWVVW
jgi:hypothetical protein